MSGNGFPVGAATPRPRARVCPELGPTERGLTECLATPEQRRFAVEHAGRLGVEASCPPGARFVYGQNCTGPVRWLVDLDGAILDRLRLD